MNDLRHQILGSPVVGKTEEPARAEADVAENARVSEPVEDEVREERVLEAPPRDEAAAESAAA